MKKILYIIALIIISSCATKKTTSIEHHVTNETEETLVVDSSGVTQTNTAETHVTTEKETKDEAAKVRIVEEEYDSCGNVKRRRTTDIDYTSNTNVDHNTESSITSTQIDSTNLTIQDDIQTKEEDEMKEDKRTKKYYFSDIYLLMVALLCVLIIGYSLFKKFV